ncbi:MAG: HAD family hydrolase [Erysipelotrichaceae bacterium]|nr:HAD family hydrolase [Erysipelotrichaceae bacterium]
MKETKLIIFDMDGTVYDMGDMAENLYDISVAYLMDRFHYSFEDAIIFLKENQIFPYPLSGSNSSTQLFVQMGADLHHWNEYRSARYDFDRIRKENAIREEDLLFFKEIAPIVLLTNNTTRNTERVLDHIGIDLTLFDKVQCNDDPRATVSKASAMKRLIEEYHIQPEEALSIGDRYQIDARPMLELGGKAIIVKNPSAFRKIISDYPELKNCEDYTCYF